ncbi:MAG: hypothetical protein Fues2KO_11900 [Fuerstiella sp.]
MPLSESAARALPGQNGWTQIFADPAKVFWEGVVTAPQCLRFVTLPKASEESKFVGV